jgi:hypothetical protein
MCSRTTRVLEATNLILIIRENSSELSHNKIIDTSLINSTQDNDIIKPSQLDIIKTNELNTSILLLL